MKENLRDLLQKRPGHLAKVYKECLSGGGNQESLNVNLNVEESGSPQKDLTKIWSGFFLVERELTSKELVREQKDSTIVVSSILTVRRRWLQNDLQGCKASENPLLTGNRGNIN